MLRLRTSPEFWVARSFGQLFPDGSYDNLAHVVACDATTTFAFDLEFTRTAGFSEAKDNPPMLQVFFHSLSLPLPFTPLPPTTTTLSCDLEFSRTAGFSDADNCPMLQVFLVPPPWRLTWSSLAHNVSLTPRITTLVLQISIHF